jgi:hypothetical protein
MHLQFYNNTSQDYRLHRRLQSGIITLLSSSPYYRIMVPIYNLAYLIIELLFKCVVVLPSCRGDDKGPGRRGQDHGMTSASRTE